jgi:tetratricopeptide (TPR) repeat protein
MVNFDLRSNRSVLYPHQICSNTILNYSSYPEYELRAAKEAVEEGRGKEAVLLLWKALEIQPQNVETCESMVLACVDQKQLEGALQVINRFPLKDRKLLYLKANVLLLLGRQEDAQAVLKEAWKTPQVFVHSLGVTEESSDESRKGSISLNRPPPQDIPAQPTRNVRDNLLRTSYREPRLTLGSADYFEKVNIK